MWWIWLVTGVPAVMGCPKDVMSEVRRCMTPLEIYSVDQGSLFMLMSSLDKTSQLCRGGQIQSVFACLNTVYNQCAKSKEGTQHFDLMVDVGKWRLAMDNICNNIHYLQDHEDCETLAYQEYKPCAEQEAAAFSSLMWSTRDKISTSSRLSDEDKTEALMDAGCSFTIKILECLKKPFTKYCPKQLTNLLVDTVEEFMPPACKKRELINTISQIPRYKHISSTDDQRRLPNTNSTSAHSNHTHTTHAHNNHTHTNHTHSNHTHTDITVIIQESLVSPDPPASHDQTGPPHPHRPRPHHHVHYSKMRETQLKSGHPPRGHDGQKEAVGAEQVLSEGSSNVAGLLAQQSPALVWISLSSIFTMSCVL